MLTLEVENWLDLVLEALFRYKERFSDYMTGEVRDREVEKEKHWNKRIQYR